MWPGVPVLPTMSAGATDGRFLTPNGIPTYGVGGLFANPETTFAHGLNERMRVESVYEGREFLDRLIKAYAGGRWRSARYGHGRREHGADHARCRRPLDHGVRGGTG